MPDPRSWVEEEQAVERLLRFLAVEGITGQEKAIAREVAQALQEAGVPRRAIRHDSAHQRIPLPTQTGNLIVQLPGTRLGPRLLFATHLDPADLGSPVMGFNVDGRSPAELTIGAVGAERWEVEVTGRAAHAGVHPEQGISATLVAALALAEVKRAGWFGKVVQDGHEGT